MSVRTGWRRAALVAAGLAMLAAPPTSRVLAQAPPESTHVEAPVAPAPPAPPPVVAPATEHAPAAAPPAAAAKPDTAAAGASPPTSAKQPDGGWPRMITTASGGTLVLYQPQIMSWPEQKSLTAMGAVSYTPRGGTQPKLGTLKLTSPTSVSVEDRLVNLQQVTIQDLNFSSLDKSQAQEVATEVQKSLPKANLVIALDRVLAAIDVSQIGAKGVKIKTDPPPIFVAIKPAILVQCDAPPILAPISGTTLKYVVNTNWDLFTDTKTNKWYLRNGENWLMTGDLHKVEDWEPAKDMPEDFEKLPDDDNWREVKANFPGKGISKSKMPFVFFSDVPAEMILIDGKPKTDEVQKKSKLLWVTNTESDLFQMEDGDYYYLVSGRWFSAKTLEGPWSFASDKLPPEFAKIPRDHERARVLSSVPGTEEAAEAVLLASIPKTARVDRKNLKAPTVTYSGDPDFKPIEGTKMSYAANSPNDVILLNGTYYLCYEGIWFKSGASNGPWVLATEIPKEIYTIPSDSPVSNVTYVTVVEDDPDYPVYGYTAGYVGVSIAFGCAMWGGGWYHPPYYHYPPYGPPVYYPRPVAYGGGAYYNPRNGSYGYRQGAYGPYGGVTRGASYNPTTGTYKRGAAAYGPGGASGWAQAYNPRTGTAAATRQGGNVYGSWGSSAVRRGDDWVKTQRTTDRNGNTRWSAQGSGGGSYKGWNNASGSGFVGQKNGDVYAGKDGNVYRKTDGGWQSWNGAGGGGWNDVNGNRPSNQPAGGARPGAGGGGTAGNLPSNGSRPSAGTQPSTRPSGGYNTDTVNQLNHDAQARSTGNQRTQSYGSSRGASRGASRGGGGRRR